ncbi:hypothetical protein LXL04_034196 [Taraxacum kok-saghyz]
MMQKEQRNVNIQNSPVTRSKMKQVVVEEEEEEEDEEEEEEEEVEVVVEMEKPSLKKRQLVDEYDDDFVDVSGPSRKQKGKGKEAKKGVVRKPKAANKFPYMKNRCSPIALLSIIHGLSKEQKTLLGP